MPLYELSSEAEEATQLPSPPADAPDPSDYGLEETLNVDNSSPTPPVQNYNFDPDFYFNGGFVIFEVEDYLFRVPTYIFVKESNHFVTEFNILAEDDFGTDRAIVLPSDIRRDDFRTLLKVLYPSSVSNTLTLTVQEWSSVLKLSTQWKFENLRKMAILHLNSLPSDSFNSVDKIILGRQNFLAAWFIAGLIELVTREETISDDEASLISDNTAFKISRMRELKRDYVSWDPYNVHEEVKSAFAAEIFSVAAEEQLFKNDPVTTIDEVLKPNTPEPSPSRKKKKKIYRTDVW